MSGAPKRHYGYFSVAILRDPEWRHHDAFWRTLVEWLGRPDLERVPQTSLRFSHLSAAATFQGNTLSTR